VETCFHYLCLSSEDIPNGRPEFKCCPPVREQWNRELLWAALRDGVIDCVVSDHSPCLAELKRLDEGDIMGAWGGISTLGLGLSLLWTEGRDRGCSLNQIVDWTSARSAKHAGLDGVKGQLGVGYDADLIVWDPDARWTVRVGWPDAIKMFLTHWQVTNDSLKFKNKLSPYDGRELQGLVEKTFVRGRLVYNRDHGEGGFAGLSPIGKLL
jgi:allantoinase